MPFGANAATKALDAMFLVGRYVLGNGKPAIENEVGDRYEEHLLLRSFFVEFDMAQDAALVARIEDFRDLAIRGDLGVRILPAQTDHQFGRHARR